MEFLSVYLVVHPPGDELYVHINEKSEIEFIMQI